MSEQIEWVTVNIAAELPECPVTSETLRRMIKRGDVPTGHWMEVPFGEGIIYYIDRNILPSLPYRERGGQTKPENKKRKG